jgi:hypothetical protein
LLLEAGRGGVVWVRGELGAVDLVGMGSGYLGLGLDSMLFLGLRVGVEYSVVGIYYSYYCLVDHDSTSFLELESVRVDLDLDSTSFLEVGTGFVVVNIYYYYYCYWVDHDSTSFLASP